MLQASKKKRKRKGKSPKVLHSPSCDCDRIMIRVHFPYWKIILLVFLEQENLTNCSENDKDVFNELAETWSLKLRCSLQHDWMYAAFSLTCGPNKCQGTARLSVVGGKNSEQRLAGSKTEMGYLLCPQLKGSSQMKTEMLKGELHLNDSFEYQRKEIQDSSSSRHNMPSSLEDRITFCLERSQLFLTNHGLG